MNDVSERWVFIKNSDNYEVSSLGRVRNAKTGRVLVPQYNRENGYLRVTIDTGRHYIQRLMAESFFDLEGVDYVVKYKDGVRTNNFLNNLIITDRAYCSKVSVVRCKNCIHRYSMAICYNQDDNFYCGYGQPKQ